MKRIPEKFKSIGKVIVGVGLIVWLISSVDFNKVLTLFKEGDFQYLLLGVGVLLIGFIGVQAFRFHWCIKNISENYGTSIKLFFLGFLFNNLLPTNFGGDAVRVMYLQQMKGKSLGKATGLLLIYRLCGLVTLITGGIVYLLFNLAMISQAVEELVQVSFKPGLKAGVLAAILAAGGLLLIFNTKLRNKIFDVIKEASQTRHLFRVRDYFGILALAFAFHFLRMVGFYYLISFFGASIGFVHLIFVLCFTVVIALIPISIGALGLMEGAITSSLLLFDVPTAAATGVALINRLVLIIIASIGGLIYLFGSAQKMMEAEDDANPD